MILAGHYDAAVCRSLGRAIERRTRAAAADPDRVPSPALKVRAIRAGRQYLATMDLPGFRRADIRVCVEGRKVSIDAARRGASALHVSRVFELPREVDGEHAEARFQEGMLALRLPLVARPGARVLAVG